MSTGLIYHKYSINLSVPTTFLSYPSSLYPSRIFPSVWLKRLWKASERCILLQKRQDYSILCSDQKVPVCLRTRLHRQWHSTFLRHHHFWNSRNGSFGLQGQDEPDKPQTPRSTEEIRSPFVCTEGGPEVATLLGVDFARLAKLVVNYYHNDTYHFHDASHEENAFVRKEKHAALPLSPFKAVQPEPMEEDVLDDPYQSPVDFDEFIKSDEWSDITRDYGPIVSPLPPISPRVAPSTIHV
ncbi:hypothetical protein GEV33_015339 [Tenebrio molitor]|jgi:hypothetical protein|nr:hypothetical protein GEV33_015339 [Tenebrio molitor]